MNETAILPTSVTVGPPTDDTPVRRSYPVSILVNINAQSIDDLLVSAFEGGIN